MGNSSSTPSSSTTTTTNGEQYDVFLSFRGEDTRDGFTSHLYHALDEKQIKTFRDDQLVRGEEISEGLLSAIRESKISVIIFSENYTSSKWCLLELAKIMKYRETKKQIVIPVFYKVEPSNVRKSYEAAFAKHKNEWRHFQEEKKIEWRPALTEASHLSGIVVTKGRDESDFVCKIVRDVWNKLYNISPSYDFKDSVGIDKRSERVVSLLCLGVPDFRIIGIWGMGGIGKSTIADAVFHLVSHQFENRTHFAVCVRNESEKDDSVIRLRDEIISKVLNEGNLKIGSHSIPEPIKRRFNQTKVLIVLDDVDKLANLEILARGLDRFGSGSRIILTSRNAQVLRNCGVEDHNIYKVEGLNDDEALQLFCKHALKQNHPTEDLEDLSREVVKIAKDVPLFVRVLGSSLYKKSNREWENAVEKFHGNVDHEGFVALKFSYDGLDEKEKDLFLDIACFLVFRRVSVFEPNLLSDRELSLSTLIDKSLVAVENDWIKMHDLLRDMGRKIASKNHSRLWRQEDIIRTLKHNDGIANAVQGISLDVDYREVLPLRDTHLISQAIEKMCNLRTLIINCTYSIGDLYYLPDGLRYLHWHMYPMEALPLSFNPMNLVELVLSHSKIKQLWKVKTPVQKLKLLNLSCCENLIRIPDLSDIPSAESIHLQLCSSLIEIHSSRGCPKLKQLDLSFCKNLIRIPDLSDIPSAESIDLKFCSSLIEIHSSRGCPKLKQLDLSFCKNLIRIPDLSDIPSVESIDLKYCISLIEIHSSKGCPKLKQLDLSFCQNLIRIPDLSDIPLVESINLESCSSLIEIHSSRGCPKLKQLDLSSCQNLIRIPDLSDIPSAESIHLQFCSSLREIHSSKECPKNLHSLNLLECEDLSRLPSNIHIEGSEFNLLKCINLTQFPHISGSIKRLALCYSGVEEVPSTIQSLSKLESLDMDGCKSLKRISKSICKLKSLDWLNLRGCCKLESFPDIMEEMELKYLNLTRTAIKELPASIGNLNRLEELDFCGCKNLERLTKSIKKLSKLYSLKLNDCGMIQSLPELPSSLRLLEAINCKQLIQSLPDESEFEQAINFRQLIESLPDSSLYFNFINCLKMNQEAVSNLLIFFRDCIIRKMQRMGTEKIISLFERDERNGRICLPGSGIPEWFSYKNNGSSINIPGLRNDCGRSSYIMGFAVCLVFGFDFDIGFFESVDVRYDFHIETRDGHKEGFFQKIPFFNMEMEKDEFSYSDHIFLGYNLSSECYELFQKLDTPLADCSLSDYVGTSFEFNVVRNRRSTYEKATKGCKVKYCGIEPIYVQAKVMNSVAINQDAGDTSGCNDTADEICEPHPKRICTEAKDFMGFVDDNSNFNSNNNNNCKETAIEELDLELHIGHSSFYDAHMNSVSINQDTGDTSGYNDTAEETCEPHLKRICTEANKDTEEFA